MSSGHGTFATGIGCMDGRTHPAVKELAEKETGVKSTHVDTITLPGMVARLASGDKKALDLVRKGLEISVNGHQSRVVIVSGHADCLGNPVPDFKHKQDILKAANVVGKLIPPNKEGEIKIIPAFITSDSSGGEWTAKIIE